VSKEDNLQAMKRNLLEIIEIGSLSRGTISGGLDNLDRKANPGT
jgi:hypothetical protein